MERINLRTRAKEFLIGLLFVMVNFSEALQKFFNEFTGDKSLLSATVNNMIRVVADPMDRILNNSFFSMSNLMAVLFLLLFIYLLLGVVLTIRCYQKKVWLKKADLSRKRWQWYLVILPLLLGLLSGCFGLHLFLNMISRIISWFL